MTPIVAASTNWQARPIRRRSKLIRHVADNKGQHQHRQKLEQADETEIERISGAIVDQPADRHRRSLERHGREGAGEQEMAERWEPEDKGRV
jgi:hypothetical protein